MLVDDESLEETEDDDKYVLTDEELDCEDENVVDPDDEELGELESEDVLVDDESLEETEDDDKYVLTDEELDCDDENVVDTEAK